MPYFAYRMARIAIFLFFSLHVLLIVAQVPNLHFRQVFSSPDVPIGLIYRMAEDNDGFIWIAGNEGLTRFDGREFQPASDLFPDREGLLGTRITELEFDGRYLWIGTTTDGLIRADLETWRLRQYPYLPGDSTSLSDKRVTAIEILPDGKVLVGTHLQGIDILDTALGVVKRYELKALFPQYTERNSSVITYATTDPVRPGTVWLSGYGIFRLDLASGVLSHYLQQPGNLTNPEIHTYPYLNRTVFVDSLGIIWIGSWGGGLYRFDPDSETFTCYFYEPNTPASHLTNNIRSIVPLGDGMLALAAPHYGLIYFDTRKESFLFPDSTLLVEKPYSAFRARNGSIWVGINQDGLAYSSAEWLKTRTMVLPMAINTFLPTDDGGGYCTFQNGLTHYLAQFSANGTVMGQWPIDVPIEPAENRMLNLHQGDGDTIWVVGYHSVHYFNQNGNKVERYQPLSYGNLFDSSQTVPYTHISSAVTERAIWMGNKSKGIFRANLSNGEVTHFTPYAADERHRITHQGWVYDISPDSWGRVWYATEVGMGYFDQHSGRMVNFTEAGMLSILQGPGSKVMREIKGVVATAPDTVWLAYGKGLAIMTLNGDQATSIRFRYFTGMSTNESITGIASTHSGGLWIQSQGLHWMDTRDSVPVDVLALAGIGQIDQVIKLTSNEAWAIRGNLLHAIPVPRKEEQSQTFRIYLHHFQINDQQQYHYTGSALPPLNLHHTERYLTFQAGVIGFSQPEKLHIQYRLKGLQQEWQPAREGYGSFTNLDPGRYELQLRAVLPNGAVAGDIMSVPVTIRPPFWTTWWFISAVVLVIAGLLYVVYRLRVGQIRRQEQVKAGYEQQINLLEVKALRSQMNPHFMFNCLNSIRNLMLKDENDNAVEYITMFSRLLRLILSHTRRETITLREDLEALEHYMQLEQLRLSNQFSYAIHLAEGLQADEVTVPPMLLQPYVENAIWHGIMNKEVPGHVNITIAANGRSLHIAIEDDGIGREAAMQLRQQQSEVHQSMGMSLTRDRLDIMARMNRFVSNIQIEDLYNSHHSPAGTRVNIKLQVA